MAKKKEQEPDGREIALQERVDRAEEDVKAVKAELKEYRKARDEQAEFLKPEAGGPVEGSGGGKKDKVISVPTQNPDKRSAKKKVEDALAQGASPEGQFDDAQDVADAAAKK